MSIVITFLVLSATVALVAYTNGENLARAFQEMSGSWTEAELRWEEYAVTNVTGVGTQAMWPKGATPIELQVANTGETAIGPFSSWDAIFEIQRPPDLGVAHLLYTESCPGAGQWTVAGIYRDAANQTPEGSGVGVLDPGEQMIVRARPSSTALGHAFDRATFATPNGIAGQVVFEVKASSTRVFVADREDATVYRYLHDGTYLGSSPLDGQNADPKGLTTDATSFWTTDRADDKVYKHDGGFSLLSSWDQIAANVGSEGMTTDGCHLWLADDSTDAVYKYEMSGSYVSEFSTTAANDDPAGMTTDGKHLWIVDDDALEDRVFKYTLDGAHVSDFGLTGGATGVHTGITTDAESIWVVRRDSQTAYKYTMSGSFVSSFPLTAANADPQGIAVTPR